MSEFAHFAEYTVTKKYEGKYGRARTLTILSYIFIPITVLFIMLALIGAGAFIWFVPLCPFFLSIIIPITYNRKFRTEYDYRIAAGDFNIAEVHNRRHRKELLTVQISKAEIIAPYRDGYRETIDRMSFNKIYETASSMNAEDLYAMVIPDSEDENEKILIFFEPTSKMLSLFSFFNRRTVSVKVRY